MASEHLRADDVVIGFRGIPSQLRTGRALGAGCAPQLLTTGGACGLSLNFLRVTWLITNDPTRTGFVESFVLRALKTEHRRNKSDVDEN